MSDDFGTVNLGRGERAREVEVLRAHYRQHRETLSKLIADAPTEHLAAEYRRLIQEIDASMLKIDELEGRASGPSPAAPVHRPKTEPGMRPLVGTPQAAEEEPYPYTQSDGESRSRLILIVVVAIVALALIGWLIWRASSDRNAPETIVDQTTDTATTTIAEEAPITPAPVADATLAVTPPAVDYGTIAKGTRATRQFEVANNSEQPVTIQVARSVCRCLYYEYSELVPPKAKETITVTVDGAKAKSGPLRETIKITGRRDPTLATSFDVIATIR